MASSTRLEELSQIHYLGECYHVFEVDANEYGMLDLLEDTHNVVAGGPSAWLGKTTTLEATHPINGATVQLVTDTNLEKLFNAHKDFETREILINLSMTDEKIDEVEGETFQWTDDEDKHVIENVEVHSDVQDSEDNLSDYESDENGLLEGVSDDDKASDHPMTKVSNKMQGEIFKYRYDEKLKKEVVVLKEGQIFNDVNHFRQVMQEFVRQEGFLINKHKNDKVKFIASCEDNECQWGIRASLYGDGVTFKIKWLNGPHTYVKSMNDYEANSRWIAQQFESDFRVDYNMSIDKLYVSLKEKYGLDVSTRKLIRAANIAKKLVAGDHDKSYAKIPQYIDMLRKTNEGVLIKLSCIGLDISNPRCNLILENFYISYMTQSNGFVNGCRPFIGINACFLKGPFKGQLLVAVSLDANSGIFPLVVMIANKEDGPTWEYFLDCLSTSIGGIGGITFMSDRQKGLKNAVKKIFPMANHRFCARHFYNNFKVKHPGPKLRQLFWAATKAYNEQDFWKVMNEMKEVNELAYNWLMFDCKEPQSSWARHKFDEQVKNDHVTNNMTESFNACVVKVREKLILTLLEWIRRKTMTRFQQKHEKALALETRIQPKVRERLIKNQKEGRKLMCFRGNEHSFEVHDSKSFVVDLREMSCHCREWQISGVSYKHALCCMTHIREDPNKFVHPLLTKEFYVKTYSRKISPVPDESKWPIVDHPIVHPLEETEKKRGRKPIKRRRESDEQPAKKRSIHCTCKKCHQIGHNSRSCSKKS